MIHVMPASTTMNCTAYTYQARIGPGGQDDSLNAQASAQSGSPCAAGKPSQSLPPAGHPPCPGPRQPCPLAAQCWTALRSSGPGWLQPPLQRACERQGTPASTLQQWPHSCGRHCGGVTWGSAGPHVQAKIMFKTVTGREPEGESALRKAFPQLVDQGSNA